MMDKLKKLKNKVLTTVFVLSWFAILALTGSFEQFRISAVEYIVYCTVAFAAIGISGAITGLLNFNIERGKRR